MAPRPSYLEGGPFSLIDLLFLAGTHYWKDTLRVRNTAYLVHK